MQDLKQKFRFPIERKWYRCTTPGCGQKLLIYDNTARSSGVYIRCKKCGREVEVKL